VAPVGPVVPNGNPAGPVNPVGPINRKHGRVVAPYETGGPHGGGPHGGAVGYGEPHD